jgi:hypothetical protein
VPNPKAFPVSGRKYGRNFSELNVKIGAHRPGLTRQDQTLPQIVGLEDVAGRHVDLTLDDGRHAGSAAAFPARVGHVNARFEQHVDQHLTARPGQPVSLTIQVDRDVCNFCHAPMVWHRNVTAHLRVQ